MYGELGLEYTEQDFAKDFGRTSRDILARRFGADVADTRVRELDVRKEAIFRDAIRNSFPAMDGARELIDALSADHFRLAVGSSGPPENIALCLEKLERGSKFGAVVTGQDVTRGKPDPQVFQIAAERLDVEPANCVVVEDAVHGITAANNAGMSSVGLTGTVTREQLGSAKIVVDSLRELTPELLRVLLASR
jgi:beta-phosphoglucomutase